MKTVTKEEFKALKKKYAPNRAMCGKPILHEDEKSYFFYELSDVDPVDCVSCKKNGKDPMCPACGFKVEYCPECERINKGHTVKRECLKCKRKFIPGCKYRFTCFRCATGNSGENEEWA